MRIKHRLEAPYSTITKVNYYLFKFFFSVYSILKIFLVEIKSNLSIRECIFLRSRASYEGGAIKFSGKQPILNGDDNIFKQNMAPYGPDFAAYGSKLTFRALNNTGKK